MIKIKAKHLKTLTEKIKGLMFADEPKSVYFETSFGIHTFLLKYEIDVVVMDERFVVKKIRSSIRPNRIFTWDPRFSKVLELPGGTVKYKNIKVGKKIHLILEK